MQNNFSPKELQVEEWIKRANDDELNARSILTHRDGTPTVVCLLSHQMAEKYLKAFLVLARNWFPKIHPLDTLVELCKEIDSSFEELRDIASDLNPFYTPARYPGDYPDFSWKDAEEAFDLASRIKEFVLEKIESQKKSGFGIAGIIIVIAAVAILGGFFGYQYLNLQNIQEGAKAPAVESPVTPPAQTQPQTNKIDTSSWKTYRNEKYGFEFRYPPEIEVQESGVGKNEVETQKGKEMSSVYTALWFRPATKLPADSHTLLVVSATPRIEDRPLLTSSKPLYILDGFYYFPSDAVGEVGKMAKEILSTFKFIPSTSLLDGQAGSGQVK